MKQLLITVMTLLVMSNVVSAQQSRSDEKLEFRPNWGLKVQGGASFTIGEADFSKLLSPAAQLSATYNFHHAMGVRFGFSGWEGKGTVVVTDEMYSFRFLQLNADYVLDLASLFGGFKHDRIWTPYVFAGIGGAYGFDNKEAGKYVAEFGDVLSRYWETAPFFVVRAGLGGDFWVAKNVALGLEANANGYSDKFNSKGAVSGFNPDFQFNALLGLKFRFGGNTRPSKAYADKVAAEEAAEAARLAAEKAAAEKAAAEKAAAERARICAEQSTDVFFTIGSYSIRKSEMPKIDKLVEFLKANPGYSVSLVGYADKATGTSARNLVISKERVNAVKAKMIQLGAPADRIETDYVGDTVQPYVENDQNRVIICTVK